MKPIYQKVLENVSTCPALALATVTITVGSTPQKQGTSALFTENGLLAGSIGGGNVEKQVADIIRKTLPSKKTGYYRFELDHDISNQDEAICGGHMDILIDADPGMHRHVFEQLVLALHQGIPGILITRVTIRPDQPVKINRQWVARNDPGWETDALVAEGEDELVFVEHLLPPPHLVIAGAGHIGKALAHLGNLLDFKVTVLDDREEYANAANIPDADHLVVGSIGQSMTAVVKTPETFIVILTRGHKDDAEALRACIGKEVAYIGMIGSARKIALMREKFITERWATVDQWEKIHTPVGLPIHSKTIQEIAVSIAAQLIQVRNQHTARHA